MKRIGLFLLLFIGMLLYDSCFQLFEPGPATVVKEFINPAKTKKAVLFIKGGNATSGDSYQISILDVNDKLEDTAVGNTFTCDNDHGNARTNSTTIKINWLGKDKLRVTYEKHIRTFIKVNEVAGISILYKTY